MRTIRSLYNSKHNKSQGDNNTTGCVSVIWVRTIATGGSNTITWRRNNRGIRTIGAVRSGTIGAVLGCDITLQSRMTLLSH
jgi:hypothetical protein